MSEVKHRRFVAASRHHPCEVCGKPDWCSRSDDGDIGVFRRQGSPDQERRDKNGGVYYVHHLRGEHGCCEPSYSRAFDHLKPQADSKPAAQPRRRKKKDTPVEVLHERHRGCLADAARQPDHARQINRLAEVLHVPAAALESLGGVYNLRMLAPKWRYRWAFPAFDANGHIIDISTRGEEGDKKTVRGSHLGLFLPDGWRQRAEQTGVVYLVEGPSDTAALWGAGLPSLGRPSNMAGVGHLAELLRPLAGRAAIVGVGERDQKPDGSWPGRAGALHTAQKLVEALGVAVRVVLPPTGYKDTREWFKSQSLALDDAAAWTGAGARFESGLETIELAAPSQQLPISQGRPVDLANVLSPDKVELIALVCQKAAR